jgi:hypothetical protein
MTSFSVVLSLALAVLAARLALELKHAGLLPVDRQSSYWTTHSTGPRAFVGEKPAVRPYP